MEPIITKTQDIDYIFGSLNDKDQNDFLDNNREYLEKISYLLIQMENNIKKYEIPYVSFKNIEQEYIRNTILKKKLFPFYWFYNEKLESMSLEELQEINQNYSNNSRSL